MHPHIGIVTKVNKDGSFETIRRQRDLQRS